MSSWRLHSSARLALTSKILLTVLKNAATAMPRIEHEVMEWFGPVWR